MLISPTSLSLTAIFLKILLIILPLLVLGRAGAFWMTSGWAKGPILSRTCVLSSLRSFSSNLPKKKEGFFKYFVLQIFELFQIYFKSNEIYNVLLMTSKLSLSSMFSIITFGSSFHLQAARTGQPKNRGNFY